MLTNNLGEELISENTSGSIDRNSRPSNFSNPTDTGDRPKVVCADLVGAFTTRTFVGDGVGYSNLGSSWYNSLVAAVDVEQRQELTTAINNNAALCRKRWTYS